MFCGECAVENRAGARFCKACGAVLEQPPAPPPPAAPMPSPTDPAPPPVYVPQPPPPIPEKRPAQGRGVMGGIAVFGGLILIILGALAAGGAFFLPWFTSGSTSYTGLDAVMMAFVEGGDVTYLAWGLAPVGAVAVLGLGLICFVMSLFGKRMSSGLARVVSLLFLLLVLSGLCGCGPLGMALLAPLWGGGGGSINDVAAGMDMGFWGALGGLGAAVVGAIVALIGGWLSRRRTAS
jgi:hypothetical protein